MNCKCSSCKAYFTLFSLDTQIFAATAAVIFSFLSLLPAKAIREPSELRSLKESGVKEEGMEWKQMKGGRNREGGRGGKRMKKGERVGGRQGSFA